MKLLLDENLPRKLKSNLTNHEVLLFVKCGGTARRMVNYFG